MVRVRGWCGSVSWGRTGVGRDGDRAQGQHKKEGIVHNAQALMHQNSTITHRRRVIKRCPARVRTGLAVNRGAL